jgi:hypothetical protein
VFALRGGRIHGIFRVLNPDKLRTVPSLPALDAGARYLDPRGGRPGGGIPSGAPTPGASAGPPCGD